MLPGATIQNTFQRGCREGDSESCLGPPSALPLEECSFKGHQQKFGATFWEILHKITTSGVSAVTTVTNHDSFLNIFQNKKKKRALHLQKFSGGGQMN